MKKKIAELFCGAGGFAQGAKESGFEHIWGVDNHKDSCLSFEQNQKCVCYCENIENFSNRYLNYFSGSIFLKTSSNVLFISFEQLCLDIETYLNIIGHFLGAEKFRNIDGPVRFNNVTSNKIDISKVNEYSEYISKNTSDLILEKNKLASNFFSSIDEQIKYRNWFAEKEEAIERLLKNFDIHGSHTLIDNVFFDPKRYLFRYNDVLEAKVNPIIHWQNNGKNEGRLPF